MKTLSKNIIVLAAAVFVFVFFILTNSVYGAQANVQSAIDNMDFERKSKNEISLSFSSSGINEVNRYVILRKDKTSKNFVEIKKIDSKDVSKAGNITYTDKLSATGYVRYEYRGGRLSKDGQGIKGQVDICKQCAGLP